MVILQVYIEEERYVYDELEGKRIFYIGGAFVAGIVKGV